MDHLPQSVAASLCGYLRAFHVDATSGRLTFRNPVQKPKLVFGPLVICSGEAYHFFLIFECSVPMKRNKREATYDHYYVRINKGVYNNSLQYDTSLMYGVGTLYDGGLYYQRTVSAAFFTG